MKKFFLGALVLSSMIAAQSVEQSALRKSQTTSEQTTLEQPSSEQTTPERVASVKSLQPRASILQTQIVPYIQSEDTGQQLQQVEEELATTEAVLATTEAVLATTEAQLATTQEELVQAESTIQSLIESCESCVDPVCNSLLDETRTELSTTDELLQVTRASYLDALDELSTCNSILESTQDELTDAISEIDEAELLLSATVIQDASALDVAIATLFSLTPCTINCASYNPNDPLNDQIINGLIPYLQSALANIGATSSIKQIAIGEGYIIILTENGAVYSAGDNTYGQLGLGFDGGKLIYFTPMTNPGDSGVTAIAAGGGHTVALKGDKAYATGRNSIGQLGLGTGFPYPNKNVLTAMVGQGTSGCTAITAGSSHTIILKGDRIYTAGDNTYGQLGIGTSGFGTNKDALTSMNGEGVSGCTAIAAGALHSLVLKGDKVYATGDNTNGQLGIGNTTQQTTLTPMNGEGTSGCTAIAAGGLHSLVLKGDKVYATGNNTNGQLGIGNTTQQTTLTPMDGEGTSGCTAINGYGYNSCFLKNDMIYSTGNNTSGQIGSGDLTNKTIPTHPKLITFN